MQMSETRLVKLMDLPPTVHGYCYHDNDGVEYVVLNARDTVERQREAYEHEIRHLDKGEMYDPGYTEYE